MHAITEAAISSKCMLLFDNWPHLSFQRLVVVIRYSYTSFFYKKLINFKNPASEFLNFSGNSGCVFLNFSQIPGSISYSRFFIIIKKTVCIASVMCMLYLNTLFLYRRVQNRTNFMWQRIKHIFLVARYNKVQLLVMLLGCSQYNRNQFRCSQPNSKLKRPGPASV